jgi:hypothetical protein
MPELFAGAGKERQDELGDVQVRFGHQAAQSGG